MLAAALKSGYAGMTSAAAGESNGTPSAKKQRVTRSSPSVPSSPTQTRTRLSSRSTIDDARQTKQSTAAERRQSGPSTCRYNVLRLPEDVLYHMISFIVSPKRVDEDTFGALQCVSKKFQELANSSAVWNRIPLILADGGMNLQSMGFVKRKAQGTEGICFQVRCRRTQRAMALKRARVYPDNEGVPYYMMRELTALKKLTHPNICELEVVNLHNYKLYLLFPYIERTLHDYISPGSSEAGVALKPSQTKHIMRQLLSAVAYCHDRCIMHRNLKPKHLLVIPGPGTDPLDNCTVQLADFALVRILVHPPRQYTTEVITLWYRPPEILLGQRNYSTAVDIWSVGCIFAELMDGRPLFAGVCEIDQLFQIFSKLGTPSDDMWPKYTSLPHFQDSLFPNWEANLFFKKFKDVNQIALSLLSKFLEYDPDCRISAEDALLHEYFSIPASNSNRAVTKTQVAVEIDSDSTNDLPVGHRGYAKTLPAPAFSVKRSRPVNFNNSAFTNVCDVSPIVLRQYLYLRYLEDDEIYARPYYGRHTNLPISTTVPMAINRSVSNSSISSISRLGLNPAGNVTSGDVDVVCLHRMELVDSLIEIMDSISVHMCARTVFFAVSIFDRYLALCDKSREDLFIEYELIGSTCLHIASKCEDVSYISVKDLALASRNISDGSAILKMEEAILNKLNFDLYIPAVIDFVGFYLASVPEFKEDSRESVLARYLSELSLMYPCFLTHPASMVATAIVAYSLLCCGSEPWPQSLKILSQYEADAVVSVVRKLNKMHSRVLDVGFNGIFERYSNGIAAFDVALSDAPVLLPGAVEHLFFRDTTNSSMVSNL